MTPAIHSSISIDGVYRDLVAELRASGVAAPKLDARLLVCHACGLSHEQFAATPEHKIGRHEFERVRLCAKRRCAREPVSRIIGTREFWGLEFEICAQTLDPRPDTETLVSATLELAGERCGKQPLSILDMGTGSGCVLISLLHEMKSATGAGTDISFEALKCARANAIRHGVARAAQFVCTSWHEGLNRRFDLVVANPPYIPTDEVAGLEPEVARFEPLAALDGGGDGLDAYREIVPALHTLLAPGGWAAFEIGEGREGDVRALLDGAHGGRGFDEIRHWRDIAGRLRCVAARRSPTH